VTTRLLFRLLAAVSFLPACCSAQSAQIVPDWETMPAESAAPAELLQFTAGGHALGFAAGGMYTATDDHALHVTFAGANAIRPRTDSPAGMDGQTAPLGRVMYVDLWDGITLAYTATAGGIYTTTYTLAPGADPAAIRLEYNAPLSINEDGGLGIAFASGNLAETAPVAWQEVDGERATVDAAFHIEDGVAGFMLGAYDPRYGLTIDPTLVWNTFLGGNGINSAYDIALDASGNIYVAGYSSQTWGSPVRAFSVPTDCFAAKLNPSGALIWNTFLGGGDNDACYGIVVYGNTGVYVTGFSDATWGSPARDFTGGRDAFAAKLNSSGSLVWNTFLGGSGVDQANGIAVNESYAYVTGYSSATWGSPVRPYTNSYDAFIVKLNAANGWTAWHTFLGGSGSDEGMDIVVDGSGNVFAAGEAGHSWGSPVRPYDAGVNHDAFAAKLSYTGDLTWHTFLGGSGEDTANGIALDSDGNIYLTGKSDATWETPVSAHSGDYDAFAARLDSSGVLAWNTFLGGSGVDNGEGIAMDRGGNVYVMGDSTASWGSPLRAYSGGIDTFGANLTSSGALNSLAFLGGSDSDYGRGGIAVDESGTYISGYSAATWGSPVRAFAGSYSNAFAARVNLPHPCPLAGMPLYDLSGDCRTDVAVFRPSTGAWYIRNQYSTSYGSAGDRPVPGDYNGDGTSDIAVYRPATGAWYIRNQYSANYGVSTDIPVPGDYNGDGTTDIAVYRPSTGAWYVRGLATYYFGAAGDIPVPGDYNGDGSTEIAVYRPSTGAWYIRGMTTTYYGVSTDIPIPGDYDGDGTTEIAVFRPSTGAWYRQGLPTTYYGVSTDIPIPGDYNGDGTTDIAVFRPSTGAWYVRGQSTVYYGASGDIPLPEMGTGKAGTAP
jgi:hypothetical protein